MRKQLRRYPGFFITEAGTVTTQLGEVKKQHINSYGYKTVSFRVGGKTTKVAVHILLCETFKGPQPEGKPFVRHLDDNKLNNQLYNLEWGSRKDNAEDAIRNGKTVCGEAIVKAKLTEATVIAAREEHANGAGCVELAKKYGVHRSVMHKVLTKKSWKHI